jgi:hypothetical protein
VCIEQNFGPHIEPRMLNRVRQHCTSHGAPGSW